MCLELESNSNAERLAIEEAFSGSQFSLIKPPERAIRGGFIVYVDCPEQKIDELVLLLEQNKIRACL